jgi:hypothetical protein
MRTYSKKRDLLNRLKLAVIIIGLGLVVMWLTSCSGDDPEPKKDYSGDYLARMDLTIVQFKFDGENITIIEDLRHGTILFPASKTEITGQLATDGTKSNIDVTVMYDANERFKVEFLEIAFVNDSLQSETVSVYNEGQLHKTYQNVSIRKINN